MFVLSELTVTNSDFEVNSFHKELECGFCLVMIFLDSYVHIRRSTDMQICWKIDYLPFHRKYVKGPISWTWL